MDVLRTRGSSSEMTAMNSLSETPSWGGVVTFVGLVPVPRKNIITYDDITECVWGTCPSHL